MSAGFWRRRPGEILVVLVLLLLPSPPGRAFIVLTRASKFKYTSKYNGISFERLHVPSRHCFVGRCPKHAGAIALAPIAILVNIHSNFVARGRQSRMSTYPVQRSKPIRFAAPPATPPASLRLVASGRTCIQLVRPSSILSTLTISLCQRGGYCPLATHATRTTASQA